MAIVSDCLKSATRRNTRTGSLGRSTWLSYTNHVDARTELIIARENKAEIILLLWGIVISDYSYRCDQSEASKIERLLDPTSGRARVPLESSAEIFPPSPTSGTM